MACFSLPDSPASARQIAVITNADGRGFPEGLAGRADSWPARTATPSRFATLLVRIQAVVPAYRPLACFFEAVLLNPAGCGSESDPRSWRLVAGQTPLRLGVTLIKRRGRSEMQRLGSQWWRGYIEPAPPEQAAEVSRSFRSGPLGLCFGTAFAGNVRPFWPEPPEGPQHRYES